MSALELHTDDGERIQLLEAPPRVGGEACVYAGHDPGGARVAVKVGLLPLPAGRSLLGERAVLDALGADRNLAARVPRVRGSGMWGDRPFLVLDWYPDTLASWSAQRRSSIERLAMAKAIADAVVAIFEARPDLRHRDIKPGNILIDGDGRPRLGDFGVARAPSSGTQTFAVFSHGYTAPELRLPLAVCPAPHHDTYGLAATLFFALVGRAPHATSTLALTPIGRAALAGRPVLGERAALAASARAPGFEAEECLDLARMTALTRSDRSALRAVVAGPTEAALTRALQPSAARRDIRASGLVAALQGSRVRRAPGLAPLAVAGLPLLLLSGGPGGPTYPAVALPGGIVALGGAVPQRQVPVEPFLLGVGEVSQDLWRDLLGVDPSSLRAFDEGALGLHCTTYAGLVHRGDALPVVCVDFAMAANLANALSERQGLARAYAVENEPGEAAPRVTWNPAANGWRLPTADEWEYAARLGLAGQPPCMQNGADRAFLALEPKLADPLPCDDGYAGPAAVDALPRDALGVRALGGNVSEWVWSPVLDGRREARGGSYAIGMAGQQPWYSTRRDPTQRTWTLGVRLARTP